VAHAKIVEVKSRHTRRVGCLVPVSVKRLAMERLAERAAKYEAIVARG